MSDDAGQALFLVAIVEELRRRGPRRVSDPRGLSVDAELWVHLEDWEQARQTIAAASILLHDRARRPHERGTVHVNTTVAMFAMLEEDPPGPSNS